MTHEKCFINLNSFTRDNYTLAYAGGDDRDQQLPLNSLNTEQN